MPRVRVIDTGRIRGHYPVAEVLLRERTAGSSTTAGGYCVYSSEDERRPVSTTVGRVGRVVSALRHHRQNDNDSRICCVVCRREHVYGPLRRWIVGPTELLTAVRCWAVVSGWPSTARIVSFAE